MPAGGQIAVVVLADTHLRDVGSGGRPGRWLPSRVIGALAKADVILHAGDVVDPGVLDRLRDFAPVHAVLGNNDTALEATLVASAVVDLGGVRIGMVHDSGRAAGRPNRLRRMFPDCQLVVFGHSHVPVDSPGVDGQMLFNPGSPTQRRRQPVATFGELIIGGGRILERRVVPAQR